MTSVRPGFALVLSMVLMLALAVLGTGILIVGTRESAVAGAVSRRAQAVRTAEAGVLAAVGTWSTRALSDLLVGESRVLGTDARSTTTTVRIDTALFLVRSDGRVPGPNGPATAHAAVLVRTLPPGRLGRALPGALAAAGSVVVADAGTIAGTDSVSGGVAVQCEEPTPGVVAPVVSTAPGASVTGRPAIDPAGPPPPPVVDPFGSLAPVLADLRYTAATATPRAAARSGACVIDSLSWGAPDPAHPCYDLLPMIAASHLTVDGGYGRGVVVVDGDLRLIGGATLEGLVIVHGQLTLEGGSTIRGAARAASAVVMDGAVIRDGCAVRAALSAPSLDRAFRPPDRWWVPVF